MTAEPFRVLVTGGSRGIGRAIVSALARTGAHALALGRDPDALQAVVEAGRDLHGRVSAARAEATDAQALVAALDEAFGPASPLDAVVVNAGISRQTPIDGPEAVDEAWLAQIETNLTGAWATVRATLPRLTPGGRIVLVASDLGRMGATGFAGYAASKHGMVGMMRALALELAPRGITVNAVCPGWVDTAMAAESFEAMAAELGLSAEIIKAAEAEALPLQRLVQPDEVAALVQFFLSPAAAAITGQAYGLDAGTTPFA